KSESPIKDVVVVISSTGGSVNQGMCLHEELKALDSGYPVTIIGQTVVMSSALYPFLAVPVERRFAFANTFFMMHSFSFHMNVNLDGDYDQHDRPLREYARRREQLEIEDRTYRSIIRKATGKTEKEAAVLIDSSQSLTPDQALKEGLISGMVTK
ncbi:MAG: Clp protease, partial [Patescibacteria group bacterium]|nr:Clp protease [Patescibacteria group bacterium]